MRKMLSLLLLTSTFATAQSIELDLLGHSQKTLDLYMKVQKAALSSGLSEGECSSVRMDLISESTELQSFLSKARGNFESNKTNKNIDVASSGSKLFGALVSTLTAANIMCSSEKNLKKEISDLHLEIANIKIDLASLYRNAALR